MIYYTAWREGLLISFGAAATIAAYHNLLASHFFKYQVMNLFCSYMGSGLQDVGNYSL